MLSLTPAGLQNTPITQYLLYGTVLNATLASIFNIKHYFPIQLIPHFINYHQVKSYQRELLMIKWVGVLEDS